SRHDPVRGDRPGNESRCVVLVELPARWRIPSDERRTADVRPVRSTPCAPHDDHPRRRRHRNHWGSIGGGGDPRRDQDRHRPRAPPRRAPWRSTDHRSGDRPPVSPLADAPEVFVEDRATWRAWLEDHHDTASGAWLVTWRSRTGKPRLAYEEAVEEALCFGW